ncbi:MAG: hypothetical protein HPY53_13630 [Brevinematales bacterium]|nr:hypothetical protein [Brevinematales bacterium]
MNIDKQMREYFRADAERMEYNDRVIRAKFERVKPDIPNIPIERPSFIGQVVSAAGLLICLIYLAVVVTGTYTPSKLSENSAKFFVKYDIPGKFEEARQFLEKNIKF